MASRFTPERRDPPILGIVRDLPSERIPPSAWLTAHNVVFRNGQIEKVKGWKRLGQAVDGRTSLIAGIVFPDGTKKNIVATDANIYSLASDDTPTKLNDAALGAAARWRMDYLLGKWYFANDSTDLLSLEASGALTAIDTGGRQGAHLAQYADHLILGNLGNATTDGPQSYLGSGLANADDWNDMNPASDSILQIAPENGDKVQDLRRVGDYCALMKENSIQTLSYIGDQFVYRREIRETGTGLAAAYSVTTIREGLPYVGQDNFYLFNGASNQDFGSRIWRWFMDQIKANGLGDIYATRDLRFKEIPFVFKSTDASDYDKALVWNWQYNAFSTRDMPFVALGFRIKPEAIGKTFDEITEPMDTLNYSFENSSTALEDFELVAADKDGNLYLLDEVETKADGVNIAMELESGDSDSGDPMRCKMIGGMLLDVPVLTGDEPLQIWAAGRRGLGDVVTWRGPFNYVVGSGRVDFFSSGFYNRYKFTKADGECVIRNYAPLVRPRGER
jgi:hypothetical protein